MGGGNDVVDLGLVAGRWLDREWHDAVVEKELTELFR